jgi:hypothetical protein
MSLSNRIPVSIIWVFNSLGFFLAGAFNVWLADRLGFGLCGF